jgi:DNA repair ATPase RecN
MYLNDTDMRSTRRRSRPLLRAWRSAANRNKEEHDQAAVEIVISRELDTRDHWLERDEIEGLAEPLRSARYELQAASANLACQRNRFPVRERDLAYAEKRAKRAIAAYAELEQKIGKPEPDRIASLAHIFRNTDRDAPTVGHESDPRGLPCAIGAALTCGFIVGALL